MNTCEESNVTINELARQTGLGVSTIWSWVARGVIEAPTVGLHDSGRGRVARWPTSVVARVYDVRRMQRRGVLLSKIAREARSESATTPIDASAAV
jgi:predicted DNA-binding transcriptional regulator AlpA